MEQAASREDRWQDRVRVLGVEQSVDTRALEAYRSNGYEDAIRSQAARMLADKLIRDASVEFSKGEPAEDDWNRRTTYQWRVAVVMPQDGRLWFDEQLTEERENGRLQGLSEAASHIRAKANIMRDFNGLIAFNIAAVADEVEALSRKR